MKLETSRLITRPFTIADLDRMAELFANKDFTRFSLGLKTREQTRAFLETMIGRDCAGLPSQFAVIERESNTPIGYCGFLHQEVDDEELIEIGYRLDPQFWNRGLATEAARAVRDHAFGDLELARVVSLIHPDNHSPRSVAEKNGMTVEKQTIFKSFPTLVFAITRQHWAQLRPVDGAA
jgi:[ribosomal protein S5]-alanine N-acetyltransferase